MLIVTSLWYPSTTESGRFDFLAQIFDQTILFPVALKKADLVVISSQCEEPPCLHSARSQSCHSQPVHWPMDASLLNMHWRSLLPQTIDFAPLWRGKWKALMSFRPLTAWSRNENFAVHMRHGSYTVHLPLSGHWSGAKHYCKCCSTSTCTYTTCTSPIHLAVKSII